MNTIKQMNNLVETNGGTEMLRKTFLKKMKSILETQKNEILSRLEKNAKLDQIDGGTVEDTDQIQARIIALATAQLAERDRTNIKKIDAAINRIENGEYGLCSVCEEDIEEKRLLAQPASAICILCAERQEKLKKQYVK